MWSLPQMAVLTAPWFLAEVRGYSKLYMNPDDYGWWYMVFQYPLFLVFTDFWIYWIHRGLHHPIVYKTLHKPHHRWIVPTPFASHAFHPIDGYSQVPRVLLVKADRSPFHIMFSHSSSLCRNSHTCYSSYSFNSGQ